MSKALVIKTALCGLLLAAGFTCFNPVLSRASGIPVVDAANLMENTMSVLEAIESRYLQIQELYTQLNQYEDQIKNSLAPAVYVWDQVEQVMNKIQYLQGEIHQFYDQVSGFDAYLDDMYDIDYWKGSEYEEYSAELDGRYSQARLRANKAVLKTTNAQLTSIDEELAALEGMRSTASGARGRMEAIQASNQLLHNQSVQLIQLRNLVAIQANAFTQKMIQDQQDAAAEREREFKRMNYKYSGQTQAPQFGAR